MDENVQEAFPLYDPESCLLYTSWFSITAGELDKKRDKPQVYFEEESAEQGTVRIRGWAIAPKPVSYTHLGDYYRELA